jgi:DNA-binding transcriptional regulator YdaS (Cro superfamily)
VTWPTNQTPTPAEALVLAVEQLGQSGLARLVGVAQPTVWKWLNLGKHLPAEHVEKVWKATSIPRHILRPDLPWDTHVPAELPPLPTMDEAAR